MASKRQGPTRQKFDKTRRVKAVARKRIGSPPSARTLDERDMRTQPKHKKSWLEEE